LPLHPIHTDMMPPEQMNNPFDYEPHPLCIMAADEIKHFLQGRTTSNGQSAEPSFFDSDSPEGKAFLHEVQEGKMFGVLIVRKDTSLYYLAAYSGQICGRSDWKGFVPAVFDYLQPDGYFKTHEKEIELMGDRISQLENDKEFLRMKQELENTRREATQETERYSQIFKEGKRQRQLRRQQGAISKEEEERMIRESQFQKAELHRIKKHYADSIRQEETQIQAFEKEISTLEQQRKDASRHLQKWLFSHFEMLNAQGESRNLMEIFAETAFKIPPAGSGECCEPKLLQYAYAHELTPLAMAMFWYGESPKMEIRKHGYFYPACNGKCKPILNWMLPTPHYSQSSSASQSTLHIQYEDDDILVIDKPAGLLSVPGKECRHSVFTLCRERYPNTDSPLIVHRLDQATSGLLVIAKTRQAYQELQQQFIKHTIQKRYLAVLDGIPEDHIPTKGTISLPMRVDPLDRPRQIIDYEHGKEAVTIYEIIRKENGRTRIALYPKTGRTHQLRVHCAHPDGLNCPILGDTLYGQKADRLYLHAESITFVHPTTKEQMHFQASVPF